ncbi:hypothetical protein PR048_022605 [Dryococelus australis]|uniref:Uncharacterized protein n=1 Tax=Dryococelus australis TaxID=614101 RepID=A0ABQ9H1S9_9NEOP|nr:hypothetical protein PR048_022605 [Dryococelus australis]
MEHRRNARVGETGNPVCFSVLQNECCQSVETCKLCVIIDSFDQGTTLVALVAVVDFPADIPAAIERRSSTIIPGQDTALDPYDRPQGRTTRQGTPAGLQSADHATSSKVTNTTRSPADTATSCSRMDGCLSLKSVQRRRENVCATYHSCDFDEDFRRRGGVVVRLLASTSVDVLDSRRGRYRIFASGNRARKCRWSAGFLGDLPLPPPSHSGAATYSPHFAFIGSRVHDVKSRPDISLRSTASDGATRTETELQERGDLHSQPPLSLSLPGPQLGPSPRRYTRDFSWGQGRCQFHGCHILALSYSIMLYLLQSIERLILRLQRRFLNIVGFRADECEERRVRSSTGMKGSGKREIPEKTRRPAASSGNILTCENPGNDPAGVWWEASRLIAQPRRLLGDCANRFLAWPVEHVLAFHIPEPGSIPGGVGLGFSHVGIVPDDAADRRVFSGISRFLNPFIPMLFRTRLSSHSSALKTSMVITENC